MPLSLVSLHTNKWPTNYNKPEAHVCSSKPSTCTSCTCSRSRHHYRTFDPSPGRRSSYFSTCLSSMLSRHQMVPQYYVCPSSCVLRHAAETRRHRSIGCDAAPPRQAPPSAIGSRSQVQLPHVALNGENEARHHSCFNYFLVYISNCIRQILPNLCMQCRMHMYRRAPRAHTAARPACGPWMCCFDGVGQIYLHKG
jgi:hypothetical protein